MTLIRNTLVLIAVTVVVTAALALVHHQTRDRIADQAEQIRLSTLSEILPESAYDNQLSADVIQFVAAAAFKTDEPVTVYRARRNGTPVAALFVVTAPDGYNGPIELLVGIWADGTIAGVRVLEHRETPGLGDKMELSESDWIRQFHGRSLDNPDYRNWAVKRNGGVFDQFTGATITPSAIVKAVRRTLDYFQNHKDQIFTTPSETADL